MMKYGLSLFLMLTLSAYGIDQLFVFIDLFFKLSDPQTEFSILFFYACIVML
jgi:hypothetical protein